MKMEQQPNKLFWYALITLVCLSIFMIFILNEARNLPKEGIRCVNNPLKYAEEHIDSSKQITCKCTEQEKPLWNLIQN
jgi:hypothetical protein